MRRTALLAALLAGIATAAHAEVRSEKNIPSALAAELVAATVEACTAKGYAVAATVVDRAGVVKATLRADAAGPHSLDSAQRKAYTAASMKAPTGAILENVQKNPAAANLGEIDQLLLLAGGLPIKSGNDVIGGIGVGGAPGGHLDAECAQAALDKLKDKLN